MVNINKVIFEFTTGNEEFAQHVNQRWESLYQPVFEKVAEEVMTCYNHEDETCIIENLPLDLGTIPEEDFDTLYPKRLREALHEWFKQINTESPGTTRTEGVRRISNQQNKLEILIYFLLHGYLPSTAQNDNIQLGSLLNEVLYSSAGLFREFLERYAHYDFLHRRLALQFTDEQLENIINRCRPSESKFVNLYTRVQIKAYKNKPVQEISFPEYRNAVWILVLAYLFTETGSRFNRKQLVLYTLRGLAARFNFTFVGLTRMVTDNIPELEKTVEQLPELFDILKEIRQETHGDMMAADAGYMDYSLREIVFSIRFDRTHHSHLFSYANMGQLLSVPLTCRKLLAQLSEKEIHRLVEIVLPAESPFIISYAQLLDRHHERNTFAGKAGNEFSLLKWEFIFQVIYAAPFAAFSRQMFVLSVIQKLGAHYNLSVEDIISFLLLDKEMFTIYSSLNVLPVLTELHIKLAQSIIPGNPEEIPALSREDFILLLSDSVRFGHFIHTCTEAVIHQLLHQLNPEQSGFIITYAQLLSQYSNKGKLEGKSGSDFQALKWKVIFSWLMTENQAFFQRKYFIYSTLSQLAAHYNQSMIDLLDYLSTEIRTRNIPGLYSGLKDILASLYNELVLSSSDSSKNIKKMNPETVSGWIIFLFGAHSSKSIREYEVKNWLALLLENHPETISALWKAGKLDTMYLLKIINSKTELQILWIKKIGGARLYDLWLEWKKKTGELNSKSIQHYIANWIVQLTLRDYLGFSENEKEHFLTERLAKSLPTGISAILKETNHSNVKQILEIMETNNNNEPIRIENAGLMLFSPFFHRLLLIYLNDDKRSFKDEENHKRAIFLLQYVVMGQEKEYDENELFLNKVIVGWPLEKPIPRGMLLPESERKRADEMLEAGKNNWPKLRQTSIVTIREAFLKRPGTIQLDEKGTWEIKVEEKPYDMLLESLPWNFRMLKHPWHENLIMTKWK